MSASLLWVVFLAISCTKADSSGTVLRVSENGGKQTVIAMSPDGGDVRTVADGPGAMYPAAPDPRGTHALLLSAEDGPDHAHRERLWLAPLAGGAAPVALIPASQRVRSPSWAPDGSYVVYESDAASFRDLYRVAREGGDPVRLTSAEHGSFEPVVSPDGARILFGTSRDGNAEIYAMAADGSNPVRLTDSVPDDVRPAWDPRGGGISWLSSREGVPRVWLAGADGSDPRPLRPLVGRELDVEQAWSPDGSRIAVVVQTGPDALDIQVFDSASGALVGTLGAAGVDEHVAWSPDGRWIVWTGTRDGEPDLRIAAPDGTSERQLTTTVGPDWLPRWVASP